jgi:hypothetical protein
VRRTDVVCDRCASPMIEGQSVVEATAGALIRRHSGPIDLCGPCGERFSVWLATGHPSGEARADASEGTDRG